MSLSNDNTKTKRMESWETSLSNTLSKPRIKRGLSFQSSLKSNESKKYIKFSAFQPQSEKANGKQQYAQNQQQKQKGISQFLLESLQDHEIKKAESIKYEDSKSHKKDLKTSRRKQSLSQSNLAEDKLASSKKIVFYNPDEHKQIDIDALKDKRNSYKNLQFKKKSENIDIGQLIAKQYEQIQKQKIVKKVGKFISEKGPDPGEKCKNELISLIFGCQQNNIRTITENSNEQDIAQHEQQQINMCTSCKKFEEQKDNAVEIFRIITNFFKELRIKFQQIEDEVANLKLYMSRKINEVKRFSSLPINFNNMSLKNQLANLNKNRDENRAKYEIGFLQKCQTQKLLKKQEVLDQFKLRKGYHEAFERRNQDENRKIESIETYFKNLNRSDKSLSQIGSIGKIVKNNGINNHKFNLPKYSSVTLQDNKDNIKLHDRREFMQTPPKLQQPAHDNSVDTSFFSQKPINRAQFFGCNKHEDVLNFTALDLMGPKQKQKELKNSLLSMRGALAKLSQLCQK